MKSSVVTTAAAVVASFAIGLAWSWWMAPRAGGVAVVDLDEVARRLGRDEEMSQSFKGQADVLNQQLLGAQKSAVAQLEEIRKGLGQEPSAEEAKNFIRLQQSAQVQLTQLKQQAEFALNNHRQQLVNRFREDAKPIAAKVAKDRGMTTVVTRNDSVVFHVEEAVDITEDVVKLMSAEMPAKTAARPASQSAAQSTSTPAPASQQATPATPTASTAAAPSANGAAAK